MQFKQWFYSEAVEFVHENFTQFYRKWKNRFSRVENELYNFDFDGLKRDLQSFDRGGENTCSDRITTWANSSEYYSNNVARKIKGLYTKPSDMAETILSSNYYEILEHIEKFGTSFRNARALFDISNNNYDYAEYLKSMMEIFENKSPEDFIAYYCGEEAVAPFMRCFNNMNKLVNLVDKMQSLMRAFDDEMGKWARSQSRKQKGMFQKIDVSEQMPSHEPFEILYHASSNVPALLNKGFKTRTELDKPTGLGGGPSDFVSFTANPRIAKSIANALKIAVKISKGEISFDDLVNKYKKLGIIDAEDVESSKRNYSDPKEQAFYLYRIALSGIEKKGLGYNPFFAFVDFKEFAKTNINDIGVVKAKIDMSKVNQYNQAEEEYRVPVDAISNVSLA
jgi:hypothetical protein